MKMALKFAVCLAITLGAFIFALTGCSVQQMGEVAQTKLLTDKTADLVVAVWHDSNLTTEDKIAATVALGRGYGVETGLISEEQGNSFEATIRTAIDTWLAWQPLPDMAVGLNKSSWTLIVALIIGLWNRKKITPK